jgi:type VI secretion system protein ImpF
MARVDREPSIVASILDRLLDERPAETREAVPYRSQSVRELRKSIARDLEALLNTRRETLEDLPADFTEVSRSLVTYGLPDLTSLSLQGVDDRARIRRALEEAIAMFEPRLERVQVTLEAPREHDRALRFRVDAWLKMEPAPEPVTFDAAVQLPTQEYTIQSER